MSNYKSNITEKCQYYRKHIRKIYKTMITKSINVTLIFITFVQFNKSKVFLHIKLWLRIFLGMVIFNQRPAAALRVASAALDRTSWCWRWVNSNTFYGCNWHRQRVAMNERGFFSEGDGRLSRLSRYQMMRKGKREWYQSPFNC